MWCKEDITTEEQAKKNHERSNGKNTSLEATPPDYDDYDVNIRLAGSGVVYDAS